MTETRMEMQVFSGVSNLLGNRPLEETMQRVLEALGPVPFDEADREFAREIRKTFTEDDIAAAFRRVGMEPDLELPLCDFVAPLDRRAEGGFGSTDVGDVSWAVPTVQARVATCALGTPGHTWQLTAHGKTGIGHKGMVHAAKIMAGTAKALMEDATLLAAAKADHQKRLARTPYVCPIPPEAKPPVLPKAA
jgi:aminobenzoyl-glutamate utilization protein B